MINDVHQVGVFGLFLFLATVKLVQVFLKRSQSVDLRGPPRTSFLFGSGIAFGDSDTALNYVQWAREYGHVYKVPFFLGINSLVICDLKAIAHVHAKDTFTYILQPAIAWFQDVAIGHNMSNSEGQEHKRLRKAMAPAFSTPVLRRMTSVFYSSAYKIKMHWDTLFESDTEVVIIDVQKWMNRMALDVVGIAGFGYDFKSLDGHPSSILDAFDAFAEARQGVISQLGFFAAAILPSFLSFPTKHARLFAKLNNAITEIARQMIENEHSERRAEDTICNKRDTSILGLLGMLLTFVQFNCHVL
jgi:cytochrome P450